MSVNGANFTGTGLFKFALVDGGTQTTGSQATATATVVNGFLVGVTVVSGGSGYTVAPTVTITDATGSGAAATATISGGMVTSVTVQASGRGYSASPTVTLDPPTSYFSFVTFWSNDSGSVGGSEPSNSVSLPVSQGLFSVLLGDTGLVNMVSIPATVFTNGDVRLRIWFNDGMNGSSQLSPDQRIAPVGYAQMAANIPDGSVSSAKLAVGAVAALNLAPNAVQSGAVGKGAIGTDQLAVGAVTTANIADGAVGASQLATSAVTDSNIAPDTIDITKLAFTPLTVELEPKVALTTSNAVPRWNGSVLTDGSIFDNGNVGIGTSNPAAQLDVSGAIAINGARVINDLGQWVGSPTGLQGPVGPPGPQGPQGVSGPTGATGAIGLQGPQGTNGNTVWNGSGVPAAGLGMNGDFYIDTIGNAIYGPENASGWGIGVSLIGPQGIQGLQGATGGAGAAGATGATGPQGPVGATGLQGPMGTNGNTVWNGGGAPTAGMGMTGDFYIDTIGKAIYGPKTGGGWGSGVSLIGPQGTQGPQGVAGASGATILYGSGPPYHGMESLLAAPGDLFLDTAAEVMYGPYTGAGFGSASWGSGVSLIGPQGAQGATGATGPQGPPGPQGPTGSGSTLASLGFKTGTVTGAWASHVTVTFGTRYSNANYKVICTCNTEMPGSSTYGYPYATVDSQSASGFTLSLYGGFNNVNITCNWMTIPDVGS